MKNFVQPGRTLTASAPIGGVLAGEAILVGSIFGIATGSALEATEVEITTEGVFVLPKATGEAWSFGDALYWDADTKKLTKTSTDNKRVGAAVAAALSADTSGRIKLGVLN